MNEALQTVAERMPVGRQRLALEGFFSIMEHWGIDNTVARRLLGSPAERTFYEWKKGKVGRIPDGRVGRDALE